MTTNTSFWTTFTDGLQERRERRRAIRSLRRELATYRSPSEIEDLLAMVDAQEARGVDVAEAATIRGILHANLQSYWETRTGLRQAAGY
ncbi:hypothetical protein JQN72_13175 [Phycicoccus sp. CSK15P-2]|uniref:hypothetical protein n=1 Tax=Phycicoccus sp. CSK15P-2 TaxID=2807627 RepID=UPI00195287E2|nr:hypothetical protein [Phycicoccus sp. CSK15P-2]MBM6405193.1 hypothetical protein [Phycicoccus sp. CSK15P-2]